jgi:3-dehydroquinate dehydratase
MSTTTDLEKTSLEAHVDLCAIRYDSLDKRLSKVEEKLEELADTMKDANTALIKVIVGAAGSVVASLLSVIVVVLMNA